MQDDSPKPSSYVADDWEADSVIPLDSILERNAFPPLITGFLLLVVCLVLFNVVGGLVGFIAIAMTSGAQALLETAQDPNGLQALVGEHMPELLIGNTVGQFLCIGLAAVVFARMTSSRTKAYLRFRRSDLRLIIIALVGLVAFQPVVSLIGELWSALPWPESWREFEAQLMEPVAAVLQQPDRLLPNLLMIAVTPALCEELLFRGYFQRNCERSVGVVGAIVLVGVVFGAYHLQPTKLLPLAALGSFFAYLTWKSGSLWPAIVAHFANNALAVSIGTYFAQRPDFDIAELENMSFDWYYVVLGLAILVGSVLLFNRYSDHAKSQIERVQVDPSSGGEESVYG
ncbi:MAG: CPBP family intramembrane metalloprotease [Rhodothermales bacterium]|nr:CPBP family intramembrane metalloprotease [Rhodothermales bacterium]